MSSTAETDPTTFIAETRPAVLEFAHAFSAKRFLPVLMGMTGDACLLEVGSPPAAPVLPAPLTIKFPLHALTATQACWWMAQWRPMQEEDDGTDCQVQNFVVDPMPPGLSGVINSDPYSARFGSIDVPCKQCGDDFSSDDVAAYWLCIECYSVTCAACHTPTTCAFCHAVDACRPDAMHTSERITINRATGMGPLAAWVPVAAAPCAYFYGPDCSARNRRLLLWARIDGADKAARQTLLTVTFEGVYWFPYLIMQSVQEVIDAMAAVEVSPTDGIDREHAYVIKPNTDDGTKRPVTEQDLIASNKVIAYLTSE
jgi:hypothetical protein